MVEPVRSGTQRRRRWHPRQNRHKRGDEKCADGDSGWSGTQNAPLHCRLPHATVAKPKFAADSLKSDEGLFASFGRYDHRGHSMLERIFRAVDHIFS